MDEGRKYDGWEKEIKEKKKIKGKEEEK